MMGITTSPRWGAMPRQREATSQVKPDFSPLSSQVGVAVAVTFRPPEHVWSGSSAALPLETFYPLWFGWDCQSATRVGKCSSLPINIVLFIATETRIPRMGT